MTAAGLVARRLAGHALITPRFDTAADVVAWYGAVQGQEYGPSTWGLAQRMRGAPAKAALDAAFDAGDILRTHILRPTWHFVAPADIRWIQKLTAARVRAFNAYWYRVNGITPRMLLRSATVIARALEGGVFLTRAEIREILKRARIDASGSRLAGLVMNAELDAIVCSGPRRGTLFTYALLDERAPRKSGAKDPDGDDALHALTVRYFRAHGPATLRDFTWWSSLKAADARRGIALAGLREHTVDDLVMWDVGEPRSRPRAPRSVRLLPIYDEYFVAYRDRQHVTTRNEGLGTFANYLVADGCLAGTWRPNGSAVALHPRRPLDAKHRSLAEREIRRYQAFAGR